MQLTKFRSLYHLLPTKVRRAIRGRWDERKEQRLYRQFVAPGDLVFDVGANVGLKTKAFLALGAHVVAVEPNPDCEGMIRRRCGSAVDRNLLHIVSCAVGDRLGHLAFYINENYSTMSSGSEAFIAAHDNVTWRKVDAELVTLDELTRRFGVPDFIKVDVEGMDAEVLQGLRLRPKFLSFEYNVNPDLWPSAKRCIQEAIRLGFSEANFTAFSTPRLLLNAWIPLARVEAAINGHFTGSWGWGDVFVK